MRKRGNYLSAYESKDPRRNSLNATLNVDLLQNIFCRNLGLYIYLSNMLISCENILQQPVLFNIQSAKTLLLPQKYEIIMLPSNYSFSNTGIAILDFSLLLLVKLSLFILFASFLVSVLSKVIALPTIAIAIVVALSHSYRRQQNDY